MILITDVDAQKAADYLRDTAEESAVVKAEFSHVDRYLKVIKARIMKEHDDKSGIIQEREAYADPRYAAHLDIIHEAEKRYLHADYLTDSAKEKNQSLADH